MLRVVTSVSVFWLLVAQAAMGLAVDPPPAESSEVDFSTELPHIPGKSPTESLQSLRLKSGFHAELVASEPLIRSPMAMDFDEYGRAFVVELPEYNQYGSSKPHGTGAIKLLTDTDGDGRYDRATPYVEDLNYPTAVACWDGGILVGVAPDILYCKDTDGDGRADVRTRVFTGFGQDKSGEGMLNSFRWRFDNQFHIPTGLDGGDIVPVEPLPARPAVSARGQHLLLEPRSWTLTPTSGGGQHGMSLDDWLIHGFVCGNSEPVHLVMYDGRYLSRNPYLQAPSAAMNIAPDGKFTRLMRISAVEPWRVLRTRLRSTGAIPGSDEGGTASGFFTGATGITVYRGNAWPTEYRGQVFVGEVANNLVYRARLEPQGIGLTAHRADPQAEFLASSDNWFRPVQFANAPDGTLYVLDMYRELIEGAAFVAPQILKHLDVSAGSSQGRIYRIAPDGFQSTPLPRLGDLSTAELVALLEHDNAWQRDTASRLIYQRQDASAVPHLRTLAANSRSSLARVMALYSLQGLGALDADLVLQTMQSDNPRARQHGLRLAEGFADSQPVCDAVCDLVRDTDVRVRYQAAFSLGAFPQPAATAALAHLARQEGDHPWLQLAILSSIGSRRGEFVDGLSRDDAARQQNHVRAILTAVATQIGASGDKSDLSGLLAVLDRLTNTHQDEELAVSLVKAVVSQPSAGTERLRAATNPKVQEILKDLIASSWKMALDSDQDPAVRVAAIKSLTLTGFSGNEEAFAELLQSRQPSPVQFATLETLARFEEPAVAQLILELWPAQTPQIRISSLELLLARRHWVLQFLEAIEQQEVSPADIDPARVALLLKSSDAEIQQRAQMLFAGNTLARRQEVVDAYQKVLELKGDIERGRGIFRKTCAACHKLEGFGESIGADLNAIKDRGLPAVLLNILDPNREVKPQFMSYIVVLDSGRSVTGMIASETANSLVIRKGDNTTETVLRVNIEELRNSGLSFMPEGLEKLIDPPAMADLLAYLNSIK